MPKTKSYQHRSLTKLILHSIWLKLKGFHLINSDFLCIDKSTRKKRAYISKKMFIITTFIDR